jgi:rubrerythrin
MKKVIFFSLIVALALLGCGHPKPTKTIEDLKAGIKEETTVSEKYAAYAEIAMNEGYDTIAKLFDATSRAEAIQAANHLKVLDKLGVEMDEFKPEYEVGTTLENLQAAIDGVDYEIKTMYVKFIEDAKAEKVPDAVRSFTWASETKKKHEQFYSDAIEALKMNAENSLPFEYAVCPVCGNTYIKASMDANCAFCQTPSDKFIII